VARRPDRRPSREPAETSVCVLAQDRPPVGGPSEASASFFKSSGMIILSGPKPASIRSRQIHTDSDSP
jgi:hypothetical protein